MPLGESSLPSDKRSASERDYTHVAVHSTMCTDVCLVLKFVGTYIYKERERHGKTELESITKSKRVLYWKP